MKRSDFLTAGASVAGAALTPHTVGAMCGCMIPPDPRMSQDGTTVTVADPKLFNKASKVVVVRDFKRTVMTMANDFQGNVTRFALVVPVPTLLTKDQIRVTDMKVIDHIDAFTAPRLIQRFDPDPCGRGGWPGAVTADALASKSNSEAAPRAVEDQALGVTVEATYSVGEYDIQILSATDSSGLHTWLTQNKYRVPESASKILGSYIKQGMRFFVAKVNLEKRQDTGFSYLRPLQVAYDSPKFMLPIRLGTVNSNGPQELVAFLFSPKGRVETTNYRTVKMPADIEIPMYIHKQKKFGEFYKAVFDKANQAHNGPVVFLEHGSSLVGGNRSLSAEEVHQLGMTPDLGVNWFRGMGNGNSGLFQQAAHRIHVTRLHVRYTADTFPEDLMFQETGDRGNEFSTRYTIRHPWEGGVSCAEGRRYAAALPARHEQQAQNLARITGWDINKIRTVMGHTKPAEGGAIPDKWWKKLWKD